MEITATNPTGRYGVVIHPGEQNEELCERYHFYTEALHACRAHLARGEDAEVVKQQSNGAFTYEY